MPAGPHRPVQPMEEPSETPRPPHPLQLCAGQAGTPAPLLPGRLACSLLEAASHGLTIPASGPLLPPPPLPAACSTARPLTTAPLALASLGAHGATAVPAGWSSGLAGSGSSCWSWARWQGGPREPGRAWQLDTCPRAAPLLLREGTESVAVCLGCLWGAERLSQPPGGPAAAGKVDGVAPAAGGPWALGAWRLSAGSPSTCCFC